MKHTDQKFRIFRTWADLPDVLIQKEINSEGQWIVSLTWFESHDDLTESLHKIEFDFLSEHLAGIFVRDVSEAFILEAMNG